MSSVNLKLIMDIIDAMCVITVIAYFLTRSSFYYQIIEQKNALKSRLLLGGIFGLFSLYGAINAIPFAGGLVSLRVTGPIIGGFMAGPWVGLIAGIIGAMQRIGYGGKSDLSAMTATLLGGLLAGIYALWRNKKGQCVSVGRAMVFTAVFEVFAGVLTLVMVQDFTWALNTEQRIRLPLLLGNVLAVGLFMLVIKNLTEERKARAAKEKIENELKVARDIQMSMVPKTFPAFPSVEQFDVYAVLEPAREVGGDLYDFFFIDDDHFCFVVGDVSGKGVPAALFMAVTRTLIQSYAGQSKTPNEILYRVNNELCKGNDSSMFVTVFFGVLNIRTGEISFSNGGHNPAVVYRQDGELELLKGKKGVALGVMDDFPYQHDTIMLKRGDTLIMYTDGVTEAMSAANDMFGEERLNQAISSVVPADGQQIVEKIVGNVNEFATGLEQFDDITVLTLIYRGNDNENTWTADELASNERSEVACALDNA